MNFTYLYYNIQKCLSVRTFIGPAPGPDTTMRPVSLEPALPEGDYRGIILPKSEQWPNCSSYILLH